MCECVVSPDVEADEGADDQVYHGCSVFLSSLARQRMVAKLQQGRHSERDREEGGKGREGEERLKHTAVEYKPLLQSTSWPFYANGPVMDPGREARLGSQETVRGGKRVPPHRTAVIDRTKRCCRGKQTVTRRRHSMDCIAAGSVWPGQKGRSESRLADDW